MPREIPDFPKDFKKPTVDEGRFYDIELITPMVGGGATAGVVDLDFPIRPTAIRGQLRHWWRLTRGSSLSSGMWRREEEIFGSTEFPSPLTVGIECATKPIQFDPSDKKLVERFGPIAYALFAAIENNHRVSKEGVKFTLRVQHASDRELTRRRAAQNEHRRKAGRDELPAAIEPITNEIETAVNAWMTFGGIGGRTRRGCGAILCQSPVMPAPQVLARIFVGPARQIAIDAWRDALSAYREFRQTPRGKPHSKTLRNGQTVRVPGRSHWPEADSLRKITGCSLKPLQDTPPSGIPVDEDTRDHSAPVVPCTLLPAFPKAVLGLPINFHFADGPNKGNAAANLDPKDTQVYPLLPLADGQMEKVERMASPVITRPFWKDGQWLPAIIILTQTLPDGLRVRIEGRNASLTGDLLQDLPLKNVIDSSLGAITPMRGKRSAIEALIDFLGSRQFTEVTR